MYPSRLLPSNDKVIKFCGTCNLIRAVDSEEDIFDEDGEVDPGFIQLGSEVDLGCFSVNLINCSQECPDCFDFEDVFIKPTNRDYSLLPYRGNESKVPKQEEVKYYVLTNKRYFLLRINEFDNIQKPFKYPTQKGTELDKLFLIKVEHIPTLTNWCHFQINVYLQDPPNTMKLIKNIKGERGYRGRIHSILRNMLLDSAFK